MRITHGWAQSAGLLPVTAMASSSKTKAQAQRWRPGSTLLWKSGSSQHISAQFVSGKLRNLSGELQKNAANFYLMLPTFLYQPGLNLLLVSSSWIQAFSSCWTDPGAGCHLCSHTSESFGVCPSLTQEFQTQTDQRDSCCTVRDVWA